MKVLFFHLMPYGALPDNFSDKYNSVWVDIDSDLFKHEEAHRMYHEYLDQLQFADELGFDGVCVNEHHSNGYALMSTPQMMATVLARTPGRALSTRSTVASLTPACRAISRTGYGWVATRSV